jgi:hypothetical protein
VPSKQLKAQYLEYQPIFKFDDSRKDFISIKNDGDTLLPKIMNEEIKM